MVTANSVMETNEVRVSRIRFRRAARASDASSRMSGSLLPLGVGKCQVLLPVVGLYVVRSRPDVVPHGMANRAIDRRHLAQAESPNPEQRVHRIRVDRRQKLALRIRPLIALCTGDIERPRRDESQQLVLID